MQKTANVKGQARYKLCTYSTMISDSYDIRFNLEVACISASRIVTIRTSSFVIDLTNTIARPRCRIAVELLAIRLVNTIYGRMHNF